MKRTPSSDHEEQGQKIIKLLEELGSFKSTYPPELLKARREAFLAQVDKLARVDEELSAEDQEIVQILGKLKSALPEYPPELLAARRSAFLGQLDKAGAVSVWDRLRTFIQRMFVPSSPAGLMRTSLVIGSLIAAVVVGSLFLRGTEGTIRPLPVAAVSTGLPTRLVPNTGEVAILICRADDPGSSCPPGELDPSQDLADPENGAARPAVSKDALYGQDQVHKAAYVNDGSQGVSWVSDSPDSWIKIDLGQTRTINTVSLKKGSLGSSDEDSPGQFVIEVALSDVYADGDSSNDYDEYSQVFHSEQAGFSGTVSQAETLQMRFPPMKARFVKITFEKAGTAIQEVGVFMLEPPALAARPTRTARVDAPESTLTPTSSLLLTETATPLPSVTWVPTDTAVFNPTGTPTPLPTQTLPPTVTATSGLINPLPSDTPIPLPTVALPTAIPVTIPASPASPSTILVSGSNQTLTFTCDGNAAEIRGHANTVTLLGSCSSITVTGNGNRVFWESGSPVITNGGRDNIVEQL